MSWVIFVVLSDKSTSVGYLQSGLVCVFWSFVLNNFIALSGISMINLKKSENHNAYCIFPFLYDFRLPHGCCPHTRWNKENNTCEGDSIILGFSKIIKCPISYFMFVNLGCFFFEGGCFPLKKFYSYRDVIIAWEGLQNLSIFCIFYVPCHTFCDTGHPY